MGPQIIRLADLVNCPISALSETAFLYQMGYLTIDKVRQQDEVLLRVPNRALQNLYDENLLILPLGDVDAFYTNQRVHGAIFRDDFDWLFDLLKTFYEAIYSTLHRPHLPQAFNRELLRTLFSACNNHFTVKALAEHPSVLILEAYDKIYLFEIERSEHCSSAQEAIAQIREKHYAAPYLSKGRPIYLIGLVFDDQTHLLVDNDVETYASEG